MCESGREMMTKFQVVVLISIPPCLQFAKSWMATATVRLPLYLLCMHWCMVTKRIILAVTSELLAFRGANLDHS